jgi:hypothetical protein
MATKAINLRLEESDHTLLKVMSAEAGLTFARTIGLALQNLRALRREMPIVDAVFTDPDDDRKLEVTVTMPTDPFEGKSPEEITNTAVEVIKEQLVQHGLVAPVAPPEAAPQGQPAPAVGADDDSWWRDL